FLVIFAGMGMFTPAMSASCRPHPSVVRNNRHTNQSGTCWAEECLVISCLFRCRFTLQTILFPPFIVCTTSQSTSAASLKTPVARESQGPSPFQCCFYQCGVTIPADLE